MSLPLSMVDYFGAIQKKVQEELERAKEARQKVGSPTPDVEPIFAEDLAERVELLVGPKGVSEKIRTLQMKLDKKLLAFKLAEDIVYSSLGKDEDEDIVKQALTTALAVLTPPCITAGPSEGISGVKIKENLDRTKYLAVYFAGPIRAAGGTELASVVVLADYIRRLFGLSKYKPTDQEISRFIEELRTYTRKVGRFQYSVSEKAVEWALRNIPVEVTGPATDRILVSSFRNLPRIETNYLRAGALRVVNDGIVGRAKKVRKIVTDMKIVGWDWLQEIARDWTGEEQEKEDRTARYLGEIIGGRPVFSFPHAFGGFRLRYGRSKTTGLASVGVHPLTMRILQDYLTTGTQLKTEYPGKGGITTPVDSIEPPIVLTTEGSVVRVSSKQIYEEIADKVSKILFLGDLLVSFGDFIYNNEVLRPPGYCEEWWAHELNHALQSMTPQTEKTLAISRSTLKAFVDYPQQYRPSAEEAIRISQLLDIPLHPRYLYFWENITAEEVLYLRKRLKEAMNSLKLTENSALLPLDNRLKDILTKTMIEHHLNNGQISISNDNLRVLVACLCPHKNPDPSEDIPAESLALLNRISEIEIRRKGASFIGARMGRPEKAGPRKMSPPVHLLFPIGTHGGPTRNIAAAKTKQINIELMTRRCAECNTETWRDTCENCENPTETGFRCTRCKEEITQLDQDSCPKCGSPIVFSRPVVIDIQEEVRRSQRKLRMELPRMVKGVRGLTSKAKCPEILEKGILRARYDLYVYKDGTIRFDVTNAPLTHFTAREIGLTPEKLRELGYTHDIDGHPLTSEHQVCELKTQDIVIPLEAAEYLLKASKFIDSLLTLICGLDPHYRFQGKEDLIGCIVVGLSPHTYVGVIGRIIGLVDAEVCFAHPVWHAAKRRDCDGDEDAIMLLMDVLINFSQLYLPQRIGGKMDSPLLVTTVVDPSEVDDQAHSIDIAEKYPLEFYTMASEARPARKISQIIPLIRTKLQTEEQFIGTRFTHPQSHMVSENKDSTYKKLATMREKITSQLDLSERLSSVDMSVVAESVLLSHILPDIMGNMRAFFVQNFRCKKCNMKYRRPPMTHTCEKCGGELTQTVFRGNIEKYVDLASNVLKQHVSDKYTKDRLSLVLENISLTFAEKREEEEKKLVLKARPRKPKISLEDFI